MFTRMCSVSVKFIFFPAFLFKVNNKGPKIRSNTLDFFLVIDSLLPEALPTNANAFSTSCQDVLNCVTISASNHEISLKTAWYQFTRGSNLQNFSLLPMIISFAFAGQFKQNNIERTYT